MVMGGAGQNNPPGNDPNNPVPAPPGDTPPPANDAQPSRLDEFIKLGTFIIAIVFLAILFIIIFVLFGRTANSTELDWQRSVYLLTGVEAVAFAAAGYLFGRDVHRGTAAEAQKRADEAEERASEETERANRGEAQVDRATNRERQAVAVADQNTRAASVYRERFGAVKAKVERMNTRYSRPEVPGILRGVTDTPDGAGLFLVDPTDDSPITVYSRDPNRESNLIADGTVGDLGLVAQTQQERQALQEDIELLTDLCQVQDIEIRTLPDPE